MTPQTEPAVLFKRLGMNPEPWQAKVLTTPERRILLNCCRQAGKSTVAAALALYEILFKPFALVIVLAPSERQSLELYKKVQLFYEAIDRPNLKREGSTELELTSHGRLVCLPCSEHTIRGFSGVTMLIIDEAARVPDDLYKTVRPMLARTNGRILIMSTPCGKRGFFYQSWIDPEKKWLKVEVPVTQVSLISQEYLEEEKRELGPIWFRQEYLCSFEALEGLVYPEFRQAIVSELPANLQGKHVGGIDFGFRNPFAAVWGVLDRNDVLWITNEYYARQQPLSINAQHLPRQVHWHCDPAGANDRAELKLAGFLISKADNDRRSGIAAVTARLRDGRLKIFGPACPNLLAEADLYHYPNTALGEVPGEEPVDEYNHALGALRYLISRVDHRFMIRFRSGKPITPKPTDPKPEPRKWLDYRNEALWTRII